MFLRGTTLQILALATIILTQTLGMCTCAAIEEFCRPMDCAPQPAVPGSGCCPDQPAPEEGLPCCLELELGWDLLTTPSGLPVPEPTVARLGGFGPNVDPCLPCGGDSVIGLGSGPDPRPAGDPLRALYCVRLI